MLKQAINHLSTRCGGLGIIEAYKNTNGGICFDCNGKGVT